MTQSREMTRDYSRLVVYQTGTSPADFAWEKPQKLLRFVQRGRILLRCGSAFALSLPSLGVSSLDLGRLFTQAALFSFVVIPGRVKREPGISIETKWGWIIPPPPGTARGRRAEPPRAHRPSERNRRSPARIWRCVRAAARPYR